MWLARRCALALPIALLLLGWIGFAGARPGGGSHYSGGSHSSSSSSSGSHSFGSSGGGGGGSVDLPPWAVVGFLGLVVLIFVLSAVFKKRAPRAAVAVDAVAQHAGIAALQGHDPTFDAAKFAERTRAIMTRVNEAWLKGDMGPARPLITDGVYVRFQTYLALLKSAGLRNVMVDWRVVGAELVAAESDQSWDTVHMKIAGEARDRDVPANLSAEEAQAKAKGAPLEPYEEVWSFLRRRGKHSRDGVPALEEKCPACGAQLPASEVVRCDHCRALVNSGEHDWVLAEITQPEEFDANSEGGSQQLLESVRAHDPTVSRQELEDRGSVIFWKWIEAQATGERKRLDRFCLQAGRPAVEPARLSEVAVGSCEAEDAPAIADGFDRVFVQLRWSARVDGAAPVNMLHRLTLARSSQAVSKRGLASLDCPNCGGSLAASDDLKCRYCGEALTGGKHEWSLESILQTG